MLIITNEWLSRNRKEREIIRRFALDRRQLSLSKLTCYSCWCLGFDLFLVIFSLLTIGSVTYFFPHCHSCGNNHTKVKIAFALSYYHMFTGISLMHFLHIGFSCLYLLPKVSTIRFSCTLVFLMAKMCPGKTYLGNSKCHGMFNSTTEPSIPHSLSTFSRP